MKQVAAGEKRVMVLEEEIAWEKDTPLLLIVKYFVWQTQFFAVAGDLGCASGRGVRANETAWLRARRWVWYAHGEIL
jgi:hypothetical protein